MKVAKQQRCGSNGRDNGRMHTSYAYQTSNSYRFNNVDGICTLSGYNTFIHMNWPVERYVQNLHILCNTPRRSHTTSGFAGGVTGEQRHHRPRPSDPWRAIRRRPDTQDPTGEDGDGLRRKCACDGGEVGTGLDDTFVQAEANNGDDEIASCSFCRSSAAFIRWRSSE